MDAFIVEGTYIIAKNLIAPEFLPVKYYGYIDWQQEVKDYTPIRNYRYYKKLTPVLKALIKTVDSMRILNTIENLNKYKVAIVTSVKIDKERDELTMECFHRTERISPMDGFIITHNLSNFLVADYLDIKYYKGFGIDHVCTSGLDTIGIANDLIAKGEAEIAICVTINSLATPIRTGYHKNLQVVSRSGIIKPFDKTRDGTIFSDAVGIVVITCEKVLKELSLEPLAKIISYSSISSSYHMFSMDESGYEFEYVVRNVIKGIDKGEILIKAHATGTKLNDKIEGKVYERVFNNSAFITALKPCFGHTLTASGLIETLFIVEYIKKTGKIYPIKNTKEIDEEVGNIQLVLEEIPYKGRYILSVASAFGGFYSALLLEVTR